MPPVVKIGDLLRVYNDGTSIFRGQWDLVDYVIPPGGNDVMPFEAAKLFFGDPRAGVNVARVVDRHGQSGYLPDRRSEVRRLRLLYDHGLGDYTGVEGPEQVWEANKIPHMRVENLNGERIVTVIEDPAGNTITPAGTTVSEESSLRDTVKEQGKLIRALMSKLGVDDALDPGAAHLDGMDALNRNVYKPDSDEISPYEDRDPTADPEIFDALPEDR